MVKTIFMLLLGCATFLSMLYYQNYVWHDCAGWEHCPFGPPASLEPSFMERNFPPRENSFIFIYLLSLTMIIISIIRIFYLISCKKEK